MTMIMVDDYLDAFKKCAIMTSLMLNTLAARA